MRGKNGKSISRGAVSRPRVSIFATFRRLFAVVGDGDVGGIFLSCVFGLRQAFECSVGALWGKGGAKAHLEEQ